MWTIENAGSSPDQHEQAYITAINRGRACGLVSKKINSFAVSDAYSWDQGQTVKLAFVSEKTERHQVAQDRNLPYPRTWSAVPQDDVDFLIKTLRGQGVFEGALIRHGTLAVEKTTGAIRVVFPENTTKLLHYLPAPLQPDEPFDPEIHDHLPWYVHRNENELPVFIFWVRKDGNKGTAADKFVKSNAPSPEVQPASYQGQHNSPQGGQSGTQSQHSSPKGGQPGNQSQHSSPKGSQHGTQTQHITEGNKHKPSPVDTHKAQESKGQKPEKKTPEYISEVFDPRMEEEEVEFLEYYNSKYYGHHGVRSKMMLREEDIDRINYISPCLAHNHKKLEEEAKNGVQKSTSTPATTVKSPPTGASPQAATNAGTSLKSNASNSTTNPLSNATSSTSSATGNSSTSSFPNLQVAPIAEDDPSWIAFNKRLDRRNEIRRGRTHPEPVFTLKYCNVPSQPKDRTKAFLSRSLYNEYLKRAQFAEQELEDRSVCCLACGLDWTKTTLSQKEHYEVHRDEYSKYVEIVENKFCDLEPVVRAETLAYSDNGVPDLGWFRSLERIIQRSENELLERVITCRVCDMELDLADIKPVDHYDQHRRERELLRTVASAKRDDENNTSDVTVLVTGDNGKTFKEFPEKDVTPSQQPPPDTSSFLGQQEAAKKEQLRNQLIARRNEFGVNLVAAGEQVQQTGLLPAPAALEVPGSPESPAGPEIIIDPATSSTSNHGSQHGSQSSTSTLGASDHSPPPAPPGSVFASVGDNTVLDASADLAKTIGDQERDDSQGEKSDDGTTGQYSDADGDINMHEAPATVAPESVSDFKKAFLALVNSSWKDNPDHPNQDDINLINRVTGFYEEGYRPREHVSISSTSRDNGRGKGTQSEPISIASTKSSSSTNSRKAKGTQSEPISIASTKSSSSTNSRKAKGTGTRSKPISIASTKSSSSSSSGGGKDTRSKPISIASSKTPSSRYRSPVSETGKGDDKEDLSVLAAGARLMKMLELMSPTRNSSGDDDYVPETPSTPRSGDEDISPRLHKIPRKTSDPLYRPGSSVNSPTSPPVTPKSRKSGSIQKRKKQHDRPLTPIERQIFESLDELSKTSSRSSGGKSVSFESDEDHESPRTSQRSPKTPPRTPRPKPSRRSPNDKSRGDSPKSPKSRNKPTKSGGKVLCAHKVKKPKTKTTNRVVKKLAAATGDTIVVGGTAGAASGRPKRAAAEEAKRNLGKTRIIE